MRERGSVGVWECGSGGVAKLVFYRNVFSKKRMVALEKRRLYGCGEIRRPLHAHVLRAAVKAKIIIFCKMGSYFAAKNAKIAKVFVLAILCVLCVLCG